jgi:rare lipoprotein A
MNFSRGLSCFSHSALALLALACTPLTNAADAPKPAAAASTPAAASATPAPAAPAPATSGGTESGLAAVYSDKLNGRKTASGERYDRNALTAAHKTLPFGTRVKVTNTKNKKTVTVRINDRGPVQAGRILDLSPAAAKALGIGAKGMGEISVEVTGEAPKSGKK